jgi:ATP-binding cassette subfamily B protein
MKENETLGIIGATGCGKSTIVNLLMRFYDVDSGEILINGRNIKSFLPQELKKQFGAAFQHDTIFSDTIKENIVFGRDISEEELQKAIKVSQAEEFIKNQPDGLDTILTPKGTNISGGQKQRLYIARALANNPKILILDDSSSALDYKTDSILRKDIKENYNCTMIIIAQRISSIKHCNKIVVVEEGKMVGYGTHEELMESSTIYKEIYQSQMGGGINE